MPIYTWQCTQCEALEELELSATEYSNKYYNKVIACKKCDSPLQRVLNAAGFVLDGVGWPGKAAKRKAEQRKAAQAAKKG